jgi:hypothetical protein
MNKRHFGALALCAISAAAVAGPQDIDLDACMPPPPRHVFAVQVGATLTSSIPVLNNDGGELYFDFSTVPTSANAVVCGGASPRFLCNGVAIELPGPAVEPAPPDAQVKLHGAATAAGVFTFKLLVAPVDGSKPGCEREYQIEITAPPQPAIPKPPTDLKVQ